MVLELEPGEGGLVELGQGEVGDPFEHGQEAALDLVPPGLLLAVLIGGVGERQFVEDAQALKALAGLGGNHGRAVVGHQGAG